MHDGFIRFRFQIRSLTKSPPLHRNLSSLICHSVFPYLFKNTEYFVDVGLVSLSLV